MIYYGKTLSSGGPKLTAVHPTISSEGLLFWWTHEDLSLASRSLDC